MMTLTRDARPYRSERIVCREIEGELILIPLTSGIADLETDIMTLSYTGRAIFEKLDGNRRLSDIVEELVSAFDGDRAGIEADVLGFTTELVRRGILVAEP